MFKKFLVALPIVCFTASLAWADTDASKNQDDLAPATDTTVEAEEPAEPAAETQSNLSPVAVTEPVSEWARRRAYNTQSATWDDAMAYESTGIDQTVRWVGVHGKQWTVRIDDVLAVRDLRIATHQDTAMASLPDDQINGQLGITIGSWP